MSEHLSRVKLIKVRQTEAVVPYKISDETFCCKPLQLITLALRCHNRVLQKHDSGVSLASSRGKLPPQYIQHFEQAHRPARTGFCNCCIHAREPPRQRLVGRGTYESYFKLRFLSKTIPGGSPPQNVSSPCEPDTNSQGHVAPLLAACTPRPACTRQKSAQTDARLLRRESAYPPAASRTKPCRRGQRTR